MLHITFLPGWFCQCIHKQIGILAVEHEASFHMWHSRVHWGSQHWVCSLEPVPHLLFSEATSSDQQLHQEQHPQGLWHLHLESILQLRFSPVININLWGDWDGSSWTLFVTSSIFLQLLRLLFSPSGRMCLRSCQVCQRTQLSENTSWWCHSCWAQPQGFCQQTGRKCLHTSWRACWVTCSNFLHQRRTGIQWVGSL